MSWTLTTSGAAMAKAGANCSLWSHAASATLLAKWSDDAEGTINTRTRYDWVSGINGVSAQFSGALSDCASSLIAMNAIAYDMSGYTSRQEAGMMLDVLRDNATQIISDLSKEENKEKLV